MHLLLFGSSVILAVAVGWWLALVHRFRDWRAGLVLAWFPPTMVLVLMAISGRFASASRAFGAQWGELRQLALIGLAVTGLIYYHVLFQRDALTGLPNRALLMDRLGRALARMRRRHEASFALLFLEIDRFKLINDSLGHAAGDRLLLETAERLRRCVQPGDTVARLGGEEFVVLLRGVDERSAARVAARMHETLSQPVTIGRRDIFTAAAIGIAVGSPAHPGAEAIVREADLAMYRAKALGKSRHEFYNVSMHRYAVDLLTLESDLRRAIERREFMLHYQPVVSLQAGRLAGLEALLRWRHPRRGILSPQTFIPIAEETNLIIPIGLWVLEEACRQMQQWRQRFPAAHGAMMHVNLSGRQFNQSDLVEQIGRILAQTDLPAPMLGLEITETVMMDDAVRTMSVLSRLRSLDVKLQIDDFGTGYSSLSYLSRFPIDILKIDRSFVGGICTNAENTKIARSIIALARDLNLEVTAEGIGSLEELRLVRSLGCALGQGNFLCPATDRSSIELLFARGRLVPAVVREAAGRPVRHRRALA